MLRVGLAQSYLRISRCQGDVQTSASRPTKKLTCWAGLQRVFLQNMTRKSETNCEFVPRLAHSGAAEARPLHSDLLSHSQVHCHRCFPVSTENHQEYPYRQKHYLLC